MIHLRFVFPLLLGLIGLPSIARPAPEKLAPPAVPTANLKKLQAGCDGGKAADCLALAEKAFASAKVPFLEKACKLNDGDGCAKYGMFLHHPGLGIPEHDSTAAPILEKALRLYEKECLSGMITSCEKYVAVHEKPESIVYALDEIRLSKQIVRFAESSCRAHPPEKCFFAMDPKETTSSDNPEPKVMVELYQIGCDAGSGIHCASVAQSFHYGAGIAKDDRKAEEYFLKSAQLLEAECAAGNAKSCMFRMNLKPMVMGAANDPEIENKYRKLFYAASEKACKSGLLYSCTFWMGILVYQNKEDPDFQLSSKPELETIFCRAGDLDSCKKELERLSKSLDDKEKKTVFTVEQIKTMGTRFFEINRAMRRHCRGGDLAFCLQLLDTRMPDFEHAGLSEAREKLVASLLAKHLRDACDQDDLAACEKLSEQFKLISEKAVNPDHLEKIAKLFDARCRTGNLVACVEFHARKLWQGLDADPARAEKYLEETAANARLACTRGQTAACQDQMQADFFLTAGRPDLSLHPELAADAVLTQFESGKFCDGMSQSECADALFTALLELPDPALAMKRFDRLATGLPGFMNTGCEGGNGKACLLLAAITKEPLSADAETNPDSRDAPAKNLIAYLENAWALKPDAQQARALLQRGAQQLAGNCAAGDMNACRMAAQTAGELASLDEKSPATPAADPLPAALEINRKGCAGGEAAACGRLGDEKMRESEEQMKPDTAALLSSACRGGDSRGCFHLARLAIAGKMMTEERIADAATRFRAACEARVGTGCRRYLMLRGDGLLKPDANAPKPAQLLEQGCEYGDLGSCHFFGLRLLRGKEDPARGLQLLKTNCDKNEAQSCGFLGVGYQYGSFTLAKDRATARHYHQRACDLGSADSCESVKELEKPEPPEEPEKVDP